MKKILLKTKNHWNYVADPEAPEDVKIFSKQWCVYIFCLLGVFCVIALITVLCWIFDVDIDVVLDFLFFGGFMFFVGFVFGLGRETVKSNFERIQ